MPKSPRGGGSSSSSTVGGAEERLDLHDQGDDEGNSTTQQGGFNPAQRISTVPPPMKIFWGYAAWGSTQLLAETARRSWGLVGASQRAGLRVSFNPPHVWDAFARWEKIADEGVVAKKTEYAQY